MLGTLAVLAVLWWLATGPLVAVHGVSVTGYDRADRGELTTALASAAEEGTVLTPATGAMTAGRPRVPMGRVDHGHAPVAARPRRAGSSRRPPSRWPRTRTQAVLVSAAGRVLGVKDGVRGLGWLKLGEAPPAAGGTLPATTRAQLAFVAAADPVVAKRIRALHLARDGTVTGRLTNGPELLLGAPERMEAKARSLSLLLASLSAEEESTAAYIDLAIPENPALGPAS